MKVANAVHLRWSSRLSALCGVVTALVVGLVAAGPAQAQQTTQATAGVQYLESTQNSDGGFPNPETMGTAGSSDVGTSAWVGIALAADGVDAKDQTLASGDTTLGDYLVDNVSSLSATTDYERALMSAYTMGMDGTDFGGVDLVQEAASAYLSTGQFSDTPSGTTGGAVNSTIFGIVSLTPYIGDDVGGTTYWTTDDESQAVSWLISDQIPSGDANAGCWEGSYVYDGETYDYFDSSLTGAALQALVAARAAGLDQSIVTNHEVSVAEGNAANCLRDVQEDSTDGGFSYDPSTTTTSDSDTTSWNIQGLVADGQTLTSSSWTVDDDNPYTFLDSLQESTTSDYPGALLYQAGVDSYPVWNTAYAVPAFLGKSWPIAPDPSHR